jgi:hypothetical protein
MQSRQPSNNTRCRLRRWTPRAPYEATGRSFFVQGAGGGGGLLQLHVEFASAGGGRVKYWALLQAIQTISRGTI